MAFMKNEFFGFCLGCFFFSWKSVFPFRHFFFFLTRTYKKSHMTIKNLDELKKSSFLKTQALTRDTFWIQTRVKIVKKNSWSKTRFNGNKEDVTGCTIYSYLLFSRRDNALLSKAYAEIKNCFHWISGKWSFIDEFQD